MADAQLERIVTRLVADSRDWTKGFTVAGSDLQKFERSAGNSLRNVGAMFTKLSGIVGVSLSVGALVAFGRSAVALADDIGDLAAAAGLSAEKFQRLQYALSFSGVSASEFAGAMNTAARMVGSFFAEQERAVKAFKMLGIETSDASIKLMTQDQIVQRLIERLADFGTHQERAAAASRIFGESIGSKLVAAAEQGIDGLNEMQRQAVVLSDEQVRVASEVNDAWDRVTNTVGIGLKGALIDALAATKLFVSSFSLEQVNLEIAKLQTRIEAIREGTGRERFVLSTSTRSDRVRELEAQVKELEAERDKRLGVAHANSPEERERQAVEAEAARTREKDAEDEVKRLARIKKEAYQAEYDMLMGRYANEEKLRKEAADKAERDTKEEQQRVARIKKEAYQAEYDELMGKYKREEELRAEREKEAEEMRQKGRDEENMAKDREIDAILERERAWQVSLQGMVKGGADAIADVAVNGEKAWDRLKQRAIAAIAEITMKWLTSGIGQPAGAATGRGGYGSAGGMQSVLDAIFASGGGMAGSTPPYAGGYAAGGVPPIGRASLVGERGIEAFVPHSPGRIVPHDRLADALGMGPQQTRVELGVEVSIEPGMTATQQRRRQLDGREQVRIAVRTAAQDEFSRRGPLSRSVAAETGSRQAPRRGIS